MSDSEQFILNYAKEGQTFSSSDLIYALGKHASRATFNTYLSRLANAGKLKRIEHGRYSIADTEKKFVPEISERCKRIYKNILDNFPYTRFCVYEGAWITPFLHHIAMNNAVYVEVERYADEAVFEWLKDNGYMVYHRPDDDFMYKYVDLKQDIVIVKVLISQSPLMNLENIKVPTLEKLLVDLYCDKDFGYAQGNEYFHIMNAAQSLYSLNRSRLLRYAGRRNVGQNIINIMEKSKYDID